MRVTRLAKNRQIPRLNFMLSHIGFIYTLVFFFSPEILPLKDIDIDIDRYFKMLNRLFTAWQTV